MPTYLTRALGLLGLIAGLGTAAHAQDSPPAEPAPASDYGVEFIAEPVADRPDMRTFKAAVRSHGVAADELSYNFELTRATASGNRSRSSQGGALSLAADAIDTVGNATINVGAGDRVLARITLSDASGDWEVVEEREMTF